MIHLPAVTVRKKEPNKSNAQRYVGAGCAELGDVRGAAWSQGGGPEGYRRVGDRIPAADVLMFSGCKDWQVCTISASGLWPKLVRSVFGNVPYPPAGD